MILLILAGGVGKRMWPIKKDKLLLDFFGQPYFSHVLNQIKRATKFEKVIVIASSVNKQALGKICHQLKLNTEVVEQKNPAGMADAILSAQHLIKGEVMIVNGDDTLEPSVYLSVYNLSQKSSTQVIVAALKVDRYFPGGYLKLKGDKVLGVVEKPGEGRQPSDVVKLVVDYFKNGELLISYLRGAKSQKDDHYEVALARMIQKGIDIRVSLYQGKFSPLKYPWHVLDLTDHFLNGLKRKISPKAQIAKSALLDGPVVVSEGVRIFEGAVIRGPSFIGKNTIVGNNALIRQSIIGPSCVVGFGTEITRSYIGEDCWFHSNYLGDSVIEGDLGMGAGAILANLRLDGQTIKYGSDRVETKRDKLGLVAGEGVRIGVQASVMPGVRIGARSLVGPGVVVDKDLKENTKVVLKQSFTESKTDALAAYQRFKGKLVR
ncbi:NTP transferase domain-containing protein [Candidatus Daviesbacteria bacterium]|nr:NTP transferase domain-containing protein [Candidatus Daviesbacteria bacterium]